MSKSFIIGFIVGIILLVGSGIAGVQSPQNDLEQKRIQQEQAMYDAEVVDATPIQLGVLSERQRKHSKLYNAYREGDLKKISELIAKGTGKVNGIDMDIGLGPKQKYAETTEEYFGKLSSVSDAIIRGRVIKKVSQITEDDRFIFTEYDIKVVEVVKNNVISPIKTETNVTFLYPGGKVVVDKTIMIVKDHRYLPLPTDNKDVLLFLRYISETESYQAAQDMGSFQLDGEVLQPLTEKRFPLGVIQDGTSFSQVVRTIKK